MTWKHDRLFLTLLAAMLGLGAMVLFEGCKHPQAPPGEHPCQATHFDGGWAVKCR